MTIAFGGLRSWNIERSFDNVFVSMIEKLGDCNSIHIGIPPANLMAGVYQGKEGSNTTTLSPGLINAWNVQKTIK